MVSRLSYLTSSTIFLNPSQLTILKDLQSSEKKMFGFSLNQMQLVCQVFSPIKPQFYIIFQPHVTTNNRVETHICFLILG